MIKENNGTAFVITSEVLKAKRVLKLQNLCVPLIFTWSDKGKQIEGTVCLNKCNLQNVVLEICIQLRDTNNNFKLKKKKVIFVASK